MKRLQMWCALLGVVSLLLAPPARAAEVYLGTITGAASTNNLTTASVFTIGPQSNLVVYCDIAVRVKWGEDSTTTAATSGANTGLPLDAGEKWITWSTSSLDVLAIVPTTAATFTCNVYAVL